MHSVLVFQSIRKLWFACLTCLFYATGLSAQTLQLSLEDGRIAARNAALSGNFELARDFALALTQANPDDRSALIVLAAALPQLGEAREGRRAGARAFALSRNDAERYEAARLTALAAANEERYTLSQIWLRRAAIYAPDERAIRQTRSDYRGIRNLNPLSVNLGFSITPSNNVNGGSDNAFNIIDGIIDGNGNPLNGYFNGAARALPGTAATADIRLSYAISGDANQSTSVSARAYARSVWLNAEGREIAPDSRNSDFGSQRLEFSLDHRRRAGDGILSAHGLIGASWFGGDLNSGYVRTRLSYGRSLNERTRLTITGSLEQTFDPSPWTANNERGTLAASLTFITQSGNRVGTSLSYDAQASDNLNERYESLTAQLTYVWTDPIGPVQLSAALGASLADYRDYTIILPVPDGRQDTRIFASLSATFPDIDYAGFVPVVTLGLQDTQSNVSRFERSEFSLDVGIRSSF